MIKPRRPQWPNPADTPVDRARAIATDLHQRLARHDPDEAAAVAAAAAALGEPWLTPRPAIYSDNHLLTATEASAYLGGDPQPGTIRQWANRAHLCRYHDERGRTVYRLGDITGHIAEQRRRRHNRHTA